jgi:hypothetical protein
MKLETHGIGEASLREAPQDEERLLMPSKAYLMLRARRARLEARTAAMQPSPANFLTALKVGIYFNRRYRLSPA